LSVQRLCCFTHHLHDEMPFILQPFHTHCTRNMNLQTLIW